MSRFTQKIKIRNPPVQAIILAAGAGARTKTYEPRCLLRYENQTILERQIEIIKNRFSKAEITVVGGVEKNKLIKKLERPHRFVENQLYDSTNSGESLRLAVNNSNLDYILFLHGDLILSNGILSRINPNQSSLLVTNSGMIGSKEVGVTIADGQASILSYGLPCKWCQIAFLSMREVEILRRLITKADYNARNLLTFEIINNMIDDGAAFTCLDIGDSFIREVDSMKDLNYENISN